MPENEKTYENCISLSSQFIMCGNCFRIDTYKECDFGCIYCFVNNSHFRQSKTRKIANIDKIKRWFLEALDIGMKHSLKHELLNKKVPLQLGGQSDPFQKREWEYRVTLELLQLSKEYCYPVTISTKIAGLPQEYWDVLSPDIHAFQISLMGLSDSYIRRFEKLTPLASERIKFIRELKDRGFWVSIRIQPVIDIQEAIELIKNTQDTVDYYTVEHLKLPVGGTGMYATYKQIAQTISEYGIKFIKRENEFEFDTESKRKNIELIKSITNVKIGCGDNDLHLLSDSVNCCGVDTMPPAFENWLKYNSMYIQMTGDRDVWYPTNSCNSSLYSKQRIPGNTSVVPYVERHIKKIYEEKQIQIKVDEIKKLNMPSSHIRFANKSDADKIKLLGDKIFGNGYLSNWSATKSICLIAIEDTKIIGMIQVLPSYKHGHLKLLMVDEDYRRRGIGTDLYESALEILQELYKPLHLSTFCWKESPNSNIVTFLEKKGWKQNMVEENYWYQDSLDKDYQCIKCGNPCVCTAIHMSLSIDL